MMGHVEKRNLSAPLTSRLEVNDVLPAQLSTFSTSVFRSNLPSLCSFFFPPARFLSATLPLSPNLLFTIPPNSPCSSPPSSSQSASEPSAALGTSSSLFLVTVFHFSFFFNHSLACYSPSSSSSFPSCAWPFLPLFKLSLFSVNVCPPSLVRLKINDWLVHSSV